MTYIVTSESEINKISAPALPTAPDQYSAAYQSQFGNVLRLYFNRVQGILSQLSTDSGILPALTAYTVATLPSAVTSGVGARAFVSDATATTFASTVAGGGANKVPVYSDGTNWKVG
jgi:hypothetical protein